MKIHKLAAMKIKYSPEICFGIFMLCVLLLMYHNVFDNFFFTDDGKWLLKAQELRYHPSGLFKSIDGKFRPLVFLVFFMEHSVFGHAPRGYFFVNFILFYINVMLAYLFIRALCEHCRAVTSPRTVAFFTSFLFSIQAMVCVTALWISLQHDLLNTTFYLLCLINYIRYTETQHPRLYIAAFIFFLLSLTTKETGASLPAVLILVHVVTGRELNKKTCLFFLPYFLLTAFFMLLYPHALSPAKSGSSLWTFTIITMRHIVESALSLFGFSQNKTLWLEPGFSHGLFQKMNFSRLFLALTLFTLLLASWKPFLKNNLLRRNTAKTFLFCMLWIILTFLPHFPLQHLILWDWVAFSPGYHYFYLSTLGLCFLCGAVFTSLLEICSPRRLRFALFYALPLSIFLNNFFPVLHMEKVYGYHSAALHYLLDRINTAASHKNTAQIVLVNFPSQYQSLHYASLPYLVSFYNPDIHGGTIHWVDKNQLGSAPSLPHKGRSAAILFYRAPFDIIIPPLSSN